MDKNWFVSVEGKTYGPYTWAQMYEMTQEGRIVSSTMIHHDQLGGWVEAYTVKELNLQAPTITVQPQVVYSNQPVMQGAYEQGPVYEVPKKKGKGCRIGCLSFLALTFVGFVLLAVFIVKPLLDSDMMDLGKATSLEKETIDPSGGIITIKDSDSDIKGMTIEVPSGAYDDDVDFEISTKPIKDHGFGDKLNPVTPMIHVDNGGDMAESFMTLTIPIEIEDDEFAVACYYKADGSLEVLPMIALENDEITVGVTHFSELFVTALKKVYLEEYVQTVDIDSGFMPGIDTWSFPNYGSEIASGGMCTGMTLSMAQYYVNHTKKGDYVLSSLLDNNQYYNTPDFWQDDSMGIRLTSVVQKGCHWGGFIHWRTEAMHRSKILTDQQTYYHIAYAFMLTDNAPQPLAIRVRTVDENNKVTIEHGHCILAYAIDANGIYVCDPNFPDRTDLVIPYDGENLGVYNTSTNSRESQYDFNVFALSGASSLYSEDAIERLFKEAEKGTYDHTIGDRQFTDAGFQAYILEEDEVRVVENVEVIELLPEDSAKYKEKIQSFLLDNGYVDTWESRPADWDDRAYIMCLVYSGAPHTGVSVYKNKDEKPLSGELFRQEGHVIYVPIDEGMTDIGFNFYRRLEKTRKDGTTYYVYMAVDFLRTVIYYGEVDLSGTWTGEFQILNYEKAMNYAEEIAFQIAKGIAWGLAEMFDQDFTDAELEAIARDSIEVNEGLLDPMPITVTLTKENNNTYEAQVELVTDYAYAYDTTATFDGQALTFQITHEDGAVFHFKYDVYNNEAISGEFDVDYGAIGDFMTGVSDLKKE